jgi:response regulator RpfG family c-di-GMP phosphodiesterase
MSDELFFAEEDTGLQSTLEPWYVAVVDDEEQVHKVTQLALSHFTFDGRPVEFLSCYSAEEARELFTRRDDIAVCLLDVVMESDDAGLTLVKFIRQDTKNDKVRIVLRTGQPGQAPEAKVISEYDINDYKEKTELTRNKLHTLMYSCLRSYRDIVALDRQRKGLEQVTSLLDSNADSSFYGFTNGFAGHDHDGISEVLAGTGDYAENTGIDPFELLPSGMIHAVENHEQDFVAIHTDDEFLASLRSEDNGLNFLYMKGLRVRNEVERTLLNLFTRNVLVAFENFYLKAEVEKAQQELVLMLGEAVETRSKETGNHLNRVALISELIAREHGLTTDMVNLIKEAAPLHDLGKIGIPDSILNKPGPLDEQEWAIMQTHVSLGWEMLKDSQRRVLKVGARIARDHHERWDGHGYPYQRAGEQISIEGRIVAIADVIDALASKRCYKEEWDWDDIKEYLLSQSGKQFDPTLVAIAQQHMEHFKQMREDYPDLPNA